VLLLLLLLLLFGVVVVCQVVGTTDAIGMMQDWVLMVDGNEDCDCVVCGCCAVQEDESMTVTGRLD